MAQCQVSDDEHGIDGELGRFASLEWKPQRCMDEAMITGLRMANGTFMISYAVGMSDEMLCVDFCGREE